MPPTREDLTRPVATLIGDTAARLRTEVAPDLVAVLAGGVDAMGERVERRPGSLSDAHMILSRLSAFELDVLKDRGTGLAASLCALVPSGGLTRDALLAQVKAVDAKRERVRLDHAALVDRAAELTPPVRLDHLQSTSERRREEAQRAEREARAQAEVDREAARHKTRYGL